MERGAEHAVERLRAVQRPCRELEYVLVNGPWSGVFRVSWIAVAPSGERDAPRDTICGRSHPVTGSVVHHWGEAQVGYSRTPPLVTIGGSGGGAFAAPSAGIAAAIVSAFRRLTLMAAPLQRATLLGSIR